MFRTSLSSFEKLLEKATSNLMLETDWPTIMQINDLIRQGDVPPKTALASIKKKITHQNPHVAMFALDVLESCVKNCGAIVHDEVGSKAFMEQLRDVIKTTTNEKVKEKLLELIQTWAHALRKEPKYRAVQDTVNILKTDGFTFPAWKESDAMFVADSAPQWEDGDRCNRCRSDFTLLNRRHHCRACGQVFCGQCSSKMSPIPKFGIEKEVRVCEGCFEKINKPSTTSSGKESDLPIEYLNSSLAQQSQAPPPRKSEDELKEDEELQLALALSQSEAEAKSKPRVSAQPVTRTKSYSPPPNLSTSPESDPELARYLNRSYWQQQQRDFSRNPSAPVAQQQVPKQQESQQQTLVAQPQTSVPSQNGVDDEEMEEFVATLKSQVEIFVTRMKSNSSRGRSIANDSSVQTLFMNVTAMHSRLLRYIQQQDDSRVYYEGLQDKLCQVKDARAALDALREEHREKLRREAEIAERQRQMQMAQKLDIMRKKKQEYLQYQRQLALQRIQEQEREMQMRQEQQKHQYMMGSFTSLPYMHQNYENGPGMLPRFSGPPGVYPPFNPGTMPQHLSGMHSLGGIPSEQMMVGTEQGMMMPGAPPPPMGHMGMPMAPPSQQGQAPPQMHPPPPQGQMGNAPPPSPYRPDANMIAGPLPHMQQGPPMGHPGSLTPMGSMAGPPGPPPSHMMVPPTSQPQMGSPPVHQPQYHQQPSQPQPQPHPHQQETHEQKTAELISFD